MKISALQLLRGQAELDTMKAGIREVTNIVRGVVSTHAMRFNEPEKGSGFSINFTDEPEYLWTIQRWESAQNTNGVVRITFRQTDILLMEAGEKGYNEPAAQYVQLIYDRLDALLDGVVKKLPRLSSEGYLKPYLDAACRA